MASVKLIIAVLLVSQAVFTLASDGDATKCALENFKCDTADSRCHWGKCTCKGNKNGIPGLACLHQNFKTCHLVNDPEGKTFAQTPGNPMDVPLPCQYVVADYTATATNWECKVRVEATGRQSAGKFFMNSWRAIIIATRNSWNYRMTLAARGWGSNGNYMFHLGRKNFNGEWARRDDEIDMSDVAQGNKFGGDTRFYVDDLNRVHLKVPKCALDLYFRPMDYAKDIHTVDWMPGLVVGTNDVNYEITYDPATKVPFCANANPGYVNWYKNYVGLDTPELAFFYRALVGSKDTQNMGTIDPARCSAAGNMAESCYGKATFPMAFKKCSSIFFTEKLANCLSVQGGSNALLDLFKKCLECFCDGNEGMCYNVKNTVMDKSCTEHLPSAVDTFFSLSMP